jgi:glycosyltransferase involved in cell wall biosynthesis
MENIYITVLTATYNRKNELNRLYQSLLNQTEKNFQWVIIDDGSSDETEKEYGILSDADFSIEYYKKKNGGTIRILLLRESLS